MRRSAIRVIHWGFLLVGLSLLGCGEGGKSPTGVPAQEEGTSVFADAQLEQAVRSTLEKPTGVLTAMDLSRLTRLQAQGQQIKRLTGLNQAVNLQILDLADNQIRDLTPLAELTQLRFLNLHKNRINSVAALRALAQLQSLDLGSNLVVDLSPLLELEQLSDLVLTGNPLNPVSQGYIAALRKRDLAVEFDEGRTVTQVSSAEQFKIAFLILQEESLVIKVIDQRGEVINVTAPEESASSLAWSPDGAQIAFRAYPDGHNKVALIDAEGGEPVYLTDTPRFTRSDHFPVWSPDGQRIAYIYDTTHEVGIYLINADGTEPVHLTRRIAFDAAADYLAWSPDGRTIAFGGGGPSVWVVDTQTQRLDTAQLIRRNARIGPQQIWSPDGQRFVFWGSSDESDLYGPTVIYTASYDGNDVRPLTSPELEGWQPVWSPDGRRIAFAGRMPPVEGEVLGDLDIFVMNADGSDLVNITQSPKWDGNPAWSPDGRQIAFESLRNGRREYELFIMEADGTNLRKIYDQLGFPPYPYGYFWSPRP